MAQGIRRPSLLADRELRRLPWYRGPSPHFSLMYFAMVLGATLLMPGTMALDDVMADPAADDLVRVRGTETLLTPGRPRSLLSRSSLSSPRPPGRGATRGGSGGGGHLGRWVLLRLAARAPRGLLVLRLRPLRLRLLRLLRRDGPWAGPPLALPGRASLPNEIRDSSTRE